MSKDHITGELDVLSYGMWQKIYFEIKTSNNPKLFRKAFDQISRARKYGMCDYGYLVTPRGVYDVLSDEVIKL